jgi:SAM-dependent methyltransferase
MQDHDRDLAVAFDGQAPLFEQAAVQSDPEALERLVRAADLPPDSLVLDAGCGPGLVGEALLDAGHRIVGVDLSGEMVARARQRCARFGERARFAHTSVFDPALSGPFDAAVSRYVLHHVTDPLAFVVRQVDLLRSGGVLVLYDHTTDPDPELARRHNELDRARDRTHTENLTPGALVDLFARAGLVDLRLIEEPLVLDFDDWFDRGTPAESKEVVRERLLSTPPLRGFRSTRQAGDAVRIDCVRAILRGLKPHREAPGTPDPAAPSSL